MLRSRTLLAVFRETPLRAGLFAAFPLKAVIRRQQFLHAYKPQQRGLHTSRSSINTHLARLSKWRPSQIRQNRNLRQNSSKSSPQAAQEHGNEAPLSLSARFRELSRKYGWAAVGVYFGLSALDFPFCFLAVRLIGPERIGEVEHAIVHAFWRVVGAVFPSMHPGDKTEGQIIEEAEAEARESRALDITGQKEKEDASIWTQLLLAYGVHKSLIFFRVPLTAAVTPKVVKTLRGWGWNIGKASKSTKSMPK